MKTKIFYAIFLMASVFTMTSCSSEEEVYSCNPELNEWAKDNLDELHEMPRAQWLSLDESYKRPAYAAFTPKQRQSFWKQKMEEVLSLDWNEKEQAHLKLLFRTIRENPQWFKGYDKLNEQQQKEFDIFTFKWSDYAKEELEWTDEIIVSIVYRGNKVLNKQGDIETVKTTARRLRTSSEIFFNPDCNCMKNRKDDSLLFDDCSSGVTCGSNPCQGKSLGCGFIGIHPCDGYC